MNILVIVLALFFGSCQKYDNNEGKDQGGTDGETRRKYTYYKAPLYWKACMNIVGNWRNKEFLMKIWIFRNREMGQNHRLEWQRDLKPYGYDMICTDGFIPMIADDASGYMTRYGSMDLKNLWQNNKAKRTENLAFDNPALAAWIR